MNRLKPTGKLLKIEWLVITHIFYAHQFQATNFTN